MQKEYIKVNHNDHRLYKGVKIEYFYNGTHREYQTSFGNIGRYSTLKAMYTAINNYFKWCDSVKHHIDNK